MKKVWDKLSDFGAGVAVLLLVPICYLLGLICYLILTISEWRSRG